MQTIPGIWFPEIVKKLESQSKIKNIHKFDSISQRDFNEYYSKNSIPFIIKNPTPLLEKDRIMTVFTSKWKNEEVDVRSSSLENPSDYVARKIEKQKLGAFINNHWQQNTVFYAANNPVKDDLHGDIMLKYPMFYPRSFFNEPRMWLGPKRSITPLHKDIPDNFALNYFGRKKWVIFSPTDYQYLYMHNPTPETYPDFAASKVDIKNPNYEIFPEYKHATPIEFILEKGEMLYLPAGWGHFVENLEDSLLFNFWLIRDKSPAILGRDC